MRQQELEHQRLWNLLTERFYRVTLSELKAGSSEIMDLVNAGVWALLLCVNGSSRSLDACYDLANLKIASVYLKGGLRSLQELTSEQRERVAVLLSIFPYIFTINLSPSELSKFKEVIADLEVKTGSQVKNVSSFAEVMKIVKAVLVPQSGD